MSIFITILYAIISVVVSVWYAFNNVYDDDEVIIPAVIGTFWPIYGLYKLFQFIFYALFD